VSEPRWKRHERLAARALGGERLPNTGRRGPDALAGPWCIEVKTRRTLPRWLKRRRPPRGLGGCLWWC
jgi:hypothetical protein